MASNKEKNKQKDTQETNNTETSTQETVVQEAQSTSKVPTAEEIISIAVAEAEEYKALAQRIQADFENYRKRNNDSVKCARTEGNNEVFVNLLPVIDSVEIAIKVITEEKSREGVGLILKQLQSLFAKYGISEIAADGADFDPEYHNAVMQIEDEANADKVLEVLQKGYIRDGKVIRHAMVKVAK